MLNFNFVLLYVANPPASAAFYADLLGSKIVENSPTFAMLPLTQGVLLGLWLKGDVEPKVTAANGGSEIGFVLENADAVLTKHAEWKARGLTIAQEPTEMDFGHTFVALDADGNRLRVFSRSAG